MRRFLSMKRVLSVVLVLGMCLSLVACGGGAGNAKTESESEIEANTIGTKLLVDFKKIVKETPDKSAMEIAEAVLTNPVIDFEPATMEVAPGLLMGFDNAEITGFTEGAMFAPMIGSIPFVGYIFTVESEDAGKALEETLKSNANKRWVVCTEADEIVTSVDGNHVFFVMAPNSFDEEPIE